MTPYRFQVCAGSHTRHRSPSDFWPVHLPPALQLFLKVSVHQRGAETLLHLGPRSAVSRSLEPVQAKDPTSGIASQERAAARWAGQSAVLRGVVRQLVHPHRHRLRRLGPYRHRGTRPPRSVPVGEAGEPALDRRCGGRRRTSSRQRAGRAPARWRRSGPGPLQRTVLRSSARRELHDGLDDGQGVLRTMVHLAHQQPEPCFRLRRSVISAAMLTTSRRPRPSRPTGAERNAQRSTRPWPSAPRSRPPQIGRQCISRSDVRTRLAAAPRQCAPRSHPATPADVPCCRSRSTPAWPGSDR